MLLKHQWYFSSLCLLVLLNAACASQPVAFNDSVTAISSATVSVYTVTEKIPTPIQTSAPKLTPKHNDLLFVEFFAVTWVDCKEMNPIVNGLKKKYKHCMKLERVNYHERTPWHELLFPIGSPEFALLDSSKKTLYRWSGVTPVEEFSVVLDPLCFD